MIRTPALLALALALTACRKEEPVDLDGDGKSPPEDCNDLDGSVFPGAEELCDGVDNNCDGSVDEEAVDAATFYADADGDGYGSAAAPMSACAAPEGYVADDADCDDASALFHPGAAEADCADPSDYNCDGSVGYADADGDGVPACEECDDARADVHPSAPEVCDEADNNCNGLTDEEATDAPTWHLDADGDGFGSAVMILAACEAPAGYVADATDCDDLAASAFPGGAERCDGLDNDCDGGVDVGAADASPWYADADGDLYGNGAQVTLACEAPEGSVANGEDCDDTAAAAHPGGTEVCDGLDNDCEGSADAGAADAPTWFADADADGYGLSAGAVRACAAPAGHSALDGDCNDSAASAYPGGVEVCADGLDNDCDGSVNEADAADAAVWHLDADGDAHGRADAGTRACLAPANSVASSDDCDDLRAEVYPGAAELCDGLANTCGALPSQEADADADGFMACEGDCDDTKAGVKPGSNEHCDSVDEDCDGSVDEGAVDPTVWHLDGDGDGYGRAAAGMAACVAPAGHVASADDCDDSAIGVHPEAEDLVGNALDEDCDGADAAPLVFTGARFSGALTALNALTGAVVWEATLPGGILDVAVGVDGEIYAAGLEAGIYAVSADGSAFEILAEGLGTVSGLWFDRSTETLLATTFQGEVLEVEPATGAVRVIAAIVGTSLTDVVRREGEATLYVTGGGALWSVEPDSGVWAQHAALAHGAWGLLPDALGGFWLGVGNQDLLSHVDARGRITYRHVGNPNLYGLCSDPMAEGKLILADHVAGLWSYEPEGFAREALNAAPLEEPFSCASLSSFDRDGDGFSSAWEGGTDCDDAEAHSYPGAPDAFGDGVDANCDGMDGTDGDADGTAADAPCADADDADPAVGAGCVARSCAEHLALRGKGAPSGVYRVDPEGDGDLSNALEVFCEMEVAGGGWTLVSNRRADTVNVESCGSTLVQFFTSGCGAPTAITAADSYALSAAQRARFPHTQFMQVQYLAGVLDPDDAFLFDYSGEAFPNTTDSTNIAVAQVCGLGEELCDSAGVFWKYIGDYWFHSAMCFSGSSGSAIYRGNYGICHDGAYNGGNAPTYPTNTYNGNRDGYDQAKLWNHPNGAVAYQERMFFR